LDSLNLAAAGQELELSRTRLEALELKSPIDGVVYRVDVRLGEALEPAGEPAIVLGSSILWARLYVESFWFDRLIQDRPYEVYDSETGRRVGTGTLVSRSPYLTRRNFRTEDAAERFDVGYQEVVLRLSDTEPDIPLGLRVAVELPPEPE
jgi:hypothetical protein